MIQYLSIYAFMDPPCPKWWQGPDFNWSGACFGSRSEPKGWQIDKSSQTLNAGLLLFRKMLQPIELGTKHACMYPFVQHLLRNCRCHTTIGGRGKRQIWCNLIEFKIGHERAAVQQVNLNIVRKKNWSLLFARRAELVNWFRSKN